MLKINILKKIIDFKKNEVRQRQQQISLDQLKKHIESAPKARDFIGALEQTIRQKKIAVIAEIKKASPSRGIIREDFNPAEIAQQYESAGASCISVLTDQRFFQGSDEDLKAVKKHCSLPVLRKDFMIDPYQIYESRLIGADCILLIVAALSNNELHHFHNIAQSLGMAVLVESHNAAELKQALALDTPLIGINNRNLKNFRTDIKTTVELLPYINSERIVISESGINTTEDIQYLYKNGVNSYLIGGALMHASDPAAQLEQLLACVIDSAGSKT